MARPTVPHCKKCDALRSVSSYMAVRKRWHCSMFFGTTHSISGQEVRTSPLWCPRRPGHSEAYRRGLVSK